MHFEGEEDAEVVDGQVTARTSVPDSAQSDAPGPQLIQPAGAPPRAPVFVVTGAPGADGSLPGFYADPAVAASMAQGSGIDATGLVDAGLGLALDRRAQAIALLVKVPLFAYVALSDRMPGLVRLAAGALGAMELVQLARRHAEVEQVLPDLSQGW